MASVPSIPELTAELSRTKKGDRNDCLKQSLHAAIKLEFATIPPYLTAMWSIREDSPVAATIHEIAMEEMLHMGLACNMLVGLNEFPDMTNPSAVPTYPGPLPGNVNPGLKISLRRLTPAQLKTFMEIEYPEGGPITEFAARTYDTIGEFYAALLRAFEILDPPLDLRYQRKLDFPGGAKLFTVKDIFDVRRAIDLIRRQGEGSSVSPEEADGHLAHFYQFREVYVGTAYRKDPVTNQWGHTGAPVLMPAVWPMAEIPPGGYKQADVTPEVWQKIQAFDAKYVTMLGQLEGVWRDPNAPLGDYSPGDPVGTMLYLRSMAQELMQLDRPDGLGSYGPCFRAN